MSKWTLAVLICVPLSAGAGCSTATPDPAPQSPTVKTILVVPLSFPGQRADLETIRSRYGELLPRYIWAVSNGRVKVDVTITPWIAMPQPISEYRLGSFRIREMHQTWFRQYRLVTDAAALLDAGHELHKFDGLMLAVGADPKDLGRCGYLFRSSTRFHRPRTARGQVIPPTDVHTWNCPFPSIAYALPKMLTGYRHGRAVVPTLYDFDAQSTPGPFGYANQWVGGTAAMQYYSTHLGPWDIQSQHGIPTAAGVLPQGMTSFTKIRLGWIDEPQVATVRAGESRDVLLAPLVHGAGKTLVVRLPIGESRHYLVENRQQEGVDRRLPSEGVLIMKVDETIPEGHGPVRVVDAHPDVEHFGAAPFKSGETFRDEEHAITVAVLRKDGSDYALSIRRGPGPAFARP
ncbi:MAG: hypothetical protein HY615_07150 [Candidatus Rokubacteria bacterium]|nr:hypothetical protein [Candidatus Rokubacteria bacterium]